MNIVQTVKKFLDERKDLADSAEIIFRMGPREVQDFLLSASDLDLVVGASQCRAARKKTADDAEIIWRLRGPSAMGCMYLEAEGLERVASGLIAIRTADADIAYKNWLDQLDARSVKNDKEKFVPLTLGGFISSGFIKVNDSLLEGQIDPGEFVSLAGWRKTPSVVAVIRVETARFAKRHGVEIDFFAEDGRPRSTVKLSPSVKHYRHHVIPGMERYRVRAGVGQSVSVTFEAGAKQ